MIYFGKEDSNNLFRHTNNLTGNISQLSQTNPTCFFAHIKFLNWSYFITYGCGLDEISALEIIFNNLLLQHWGQILFEVEFDIVVPSRVSYNYCFKMAEFCPRSTVGINPRLSDLKGPDSPKLGWRYF